MYLTTLFICLGETIHVVQRKTRVKQNLELGFLSRFIIFRAIDAFVSAWRRLGVFLYQYSINVLVYINYTWCNRKTNDGSRRLISFLSQAVIMTVICALNKHRGNWEISVCLDYAAQGLCNVSGIHLHVQFHHEHSTSDFLKILSTTMPVNGKSLKVGAWF